MEHKSFRYFVILAYNGTKFHGWQIQPNAITVQQVLNEKISLLISESINIIGCGRTDTGVHAKQFVAHFDTKNKINNCNNLVFKLNSFLPKEIVIYKITNMPSEYHSRFDAVKRTYKYYVNLRKNPFHFPYSMYINYELDIEKMNMAANKLFNYNDFTSFSKTHTDTKTNDCEIYCAEWQFANSEHLVFTISANRFLRNMVRSIVGTLIDVGNNKLSVQDFCKIIEAKNRQQAKMSAPAHALFLEDVKYPYKI